MPNKQIYNFSEIDNWQKGFIKITKNVLVSYLIVSIAIFSTGLIYLFNPFSTKQADAAWFNDNWAFRKTLTFNHNATVSSPTKVIFDIDTTAAPTDFQSDCGDVRFTSPNGDILPYYYDSAGGACDTSSTDFYVLIPSIINGSNYIYMYYGNPSVVDGTRSANFSESTTTPSGGAATPGSEEKAPSPVAYWKFDDGQGTTVQDSGINNLDASIVNNSMSWKTEDNCIAGKCLANTIDGTGLARVASNTKFQQTSNVSWNIWARMSQISSSNWPTIMSHSDTHTGYGIRYNKTTGKVYFERGISTCDGQSGNYSAIDFNGSNSFADNNWHMLTMTQDGTNINLYYDGKFVSSTADSAFCSSSGLLLYFGHQAGGSIDEAKIYNYPLSAAQVAANYNARSNPEGVSSALGANTQNMPDALSDGLVGYWKMDESSWTNNCSTTSVIDSSGNGNHGSTCPNGTGATGGVAGKFANAAPYDNVDDYIRVLNNSTLSPSNLTISTWAYFNTVASNQTLFSKELYTDASNNSGYLLRIYSNNRINLVVENNQAVTVGASATYAITAGSWYHIVGTYDGQNLKIYVNGNLAGSTAYTGGIGSNSSNLAIGGTSGVYLFDGKLDDARIYNRALSPAEVSQLYNWAPGPVGYWKMDEGSGTTISDSSVNSYTSSAFTGNTAFTNGKYGKGLTFDGTDDVVRIPEGTYTDLGATTDSFTAEAWFKTTADFSTGATILIKRNSGAGGFPFAITLDSIERLNATFYDGTTSVGLTITGAKNDGKWHHAALVRDVFADTLYFYVDGVLANSINDTTTGSLANNSDISIGAGNVNASYIDNDFNGQVDDARIYNYARTSAQIIEDMNAGHPAPGSPVGSAVAHWKLDEGYGTTANDTTPNDNDLTLSTATSAWTNSGKFGKAWDGNASRYLSRADDSDFDVGATDDYSVSLWYKSDNASNPGATEYLFNKAGATTAGYAIYANTSGNLCFGIDDDTTWGPDVVSCTSTDVYDATWHHIVAVRDVTQDKTYIYLDGNLADSDSDTTSATLANGLSLYAAERDGTDNGDEFNGDLDEVKVYRSPLTADQVKIDMNKSQSQILGATGDNSNFAKGAEAQKYCIPGDSAICTAPVGQWNLDEASGTAANDSSGNANTGTITAGTGGWINGKTNGKAYNFDGANTLINAGSGTTLDDMSAVTVEAWINPKTCGEDIGSGNRAGFIAAKNVGNTQSAGWLFLCINAFGPVNALQFTVDGSTDMVRTTTDNALTFNSWQHVAVTWNGNITTASAVHIYVNGKEASYATTTNGASRVTDASSTFYIGNASTSDRTIDGALDEVKVFNYARSPSQIAYDYNQGKPVAHWKMDECQGTTINDSSGNSFTGTLTNTTPGTCTTSGAWFNGVTGKRNYSVDLDGSDDYITISDNATLRFDEVTKDYSLFAWVKRGSNGEMNIISKEDADNDGYRLQFTSGNVVRCSVDAIDIDSTLTITDTNWHHVGCTIDRDGNGQIFIDGLANGTATAISSEVMANTSAIRLGTRSYTSTNYLDGLLDDSRIYNYALSATQVKTLYNEGTYRVGPVTGAP